MYYVWLCDILAMNHKLISTRVRRDGINLSKYRQILACSWKKFLDKKVIILENGRRLYTYYIYDSFDDILLLMVTST